MELKEYQLVTPDGVTATTSKDFSGKAIATYPNGDVFDGTFVNGVSLNLMYNLTFILINLVERRRNWHLYLCPNKASH